MKPSIFLCVLWCLLMLHNHNKIFWFIFIFSFYQAEKKRRKMCSRCSSINRCIFIVCCLMCVYGLFLAMFFVKRFMFGNFRLPFADRATKSRISVVGGKFTILAFEHFYHSSRWAAGSAKMSPEFALSRECRMQLQLLQANRGQTRRKKVHAKVQSIYFPETESSPTTRVRNENDMKWM